MVIGLTGQSGSGKSEVAKIIAEYDVVILDCDDIAHQNMEPVGVAYNDIVSAFGGGILNSDKTINRKALAGIVFNDKQKLCMLNDITHKYIKDYIINAINNTNKPVFIDAPLLFEAELDKLCDKVWAVVCPYEIRLNRVMARDNISQDEAKMRFKNQKDEDFYRKNADVVFVNSGDIDSLTERVKYEVNKVFD